MKAPILIFAYNRPNHLEMLINSLEKNNLDNKRKIYLFCDGPKNKIDIKKINEIKKIVKKRNFLFIKKFRKKNLGLSKNIISGVSEVLKKHKNCIVLEDDLILNDMTISYMDKALYDFRNKINFGSVSAYSYIQAFKSFKSYDYYISKRHCSWCWGTWSRVWNKINWDNIDYKKHFQNKFDIKKFSNAGNDLNLLLWAQKNSYIDSWAIRFNYHCYKNKLLSFHPRFSLIINNGRDNSGTHESYKFNFNKETFDYHPNINLKSLLKKTIKSYKIDQFIKESHNRSLKLSLRYFVKHFRFI